MQRSNDQRREFRKTKSLVRSANALVAPGIHKEKDEVPRGRGVFK